MTIPNTKVCAVAGVMSAGADCVHALSDETQTLTLDQWIYFLEPQEAPQKGPALCMSSIDYSRLKTALEQACEKLGSGCRPEVATKVRLANARIEKLLKPPPGKGLKHPIKESP